MPPLPLGAAEPVAGSPLAVAPLLAEAGAESEAAKEDDGAVLPVAPLAVAQGLPVELRDGVAPMDSGNTLLLAEPDALVTKLGREEAVCRDGEGGAVADAHPLPLGDGVREAEAEEHAVAVAAPAEAVGADVPDALEALSARLTDGAPLLLPAVDTVGLAVGHALAPPLALAEPVEVPEGDGRLLAVAPVPDGATEGVSALLAELRGEAERRGERDAGALRDEDMEREGEGEPEPLRVVDEDTEGVMDTCALEESVGLPVARNDADAVPVPGRERVAALETEGHGEAEREAPLLAVSANDAVGALEPLPGALADALSVALPQRVPLEDAQPLGDAELDAGSVAEVSGDAEALIDGAREAVAQAVAEIDDEAATDGLPDTVSVEAGVAVTDSEPVREAETDAVGGAEAENESVAIGEPVP